MQWQQIDPSTDVSFELSENGRIETLIRGSPVVHPWLICTPKFTTSFPKLAVPPPFQAVMSVNHDSDGSGAPGQLPIYTLHEAFVDQVRRLTIEIDLTERNISNEGVLFRRWMDAFDDKLRAFVHANQRLLGKSNMSKDAIGALQKRAFRSRVSKKGDTYPDSMMVRCKAYAVKGTKRCSHARPNTIPVFLANGDTRMANAQPDIQSTEGLGVSFGDSVAVTLRLDGAYAQAGIGFGNTWTLTSIRVYEPPADGGMGGWNAQDATTIEQLLNLYDPTMPTMSGSYHGLLSITPEEAGVVMS